MISINSCGEMGNGTIEADARNSIKNESSWGGGGKGIILLFAMHKHGSQGFLYIYTRVLWLHYKFCFTKKQTI